MKNNIIISLQNDSGEFDNQIIVEVLTTLYKFGYAHYNDLTLEDSVIRYAYHDYNSIKLLQDMTFVGYCADYTDSKILQWGKDTHEIMVHLLNIHHTIIKNVGGYDAKIDFKNESVEVGAYILTFYEIEDLYLATTSCSNK